MKNLRLSFITLAAVVVLPVSGCGFKSDLYLSDRAPDSLPDLTELPTLPTLDELNKPGVPVEIPPLDDTVDLDTKKKK